MPTFHKPIKFWWKKKWNPAHQNMLFYSEKSHMLKQNVFEFPLQFVFDRNLHCSHCICNQIWFVFSNSSRVCSYIHIGCHRNETGMRTLTYAEQAKLKLLPIMKVLQWILFCVWIISGKCRQLSWNWQEWYIPCLLLLSPFQLSEYNVRFK